MKNLYIIGYGLSGGFGGADIFEVIKAKDLEDAVSIAFDACCEYYENYVGNYGLRTIDEIMEEEDLDFEEATYQFEEERESWLDYSAQKYSKEYEKEVENHHYTNRYKDITDANE